MQSTDHQGKQHRNCDVGLPSHGSARSGFTFRPHRGVMDTPPNTGSPAGNVPGLPAVPMRWGYSSVSARARHRAVFRRSRWRRSFTPAVIPAPRRPGVELVEARSGVVHRVSAEELLAGRTRGHHEGFCGVRFQAASMVEPGRRRCSGCAS